jgi:hypothetical protein
VEENEHEEGIKCDYEEGNGREHGEENESEEEIERGEGIDCVHVEERVHKSDNSRDHVRGTHGQVCVSNHLLGVSKNPRE